MRRLVALPVLLVVAAVLALAPGAAHACPACAAGAGATPPWLVALLVAAPIAAFGLTALVVRRLVARSRSRTEAP
jgi:hypothetical protein